MTIAAYSVSTKSVYIKANYKTLPDDAIDIPDDLYKKFLDAKISGFDAVDGVVIDANSRPLTAAQAWDNYKNLVISELNKTDATITRVSEAVSLGLTTWDASDVVTFVNYRRSLREILSHPIPATIPASLPTKPDYPAGT